MRIFRDDLAVEVPVRWYYVPDDRRVLPYATPFGNRDWEFAEGDPGLLLGEVYGSRRYYGGQDPVGVLAQGLCGTQQQWERGPSLLDPVRPLNPTTGRQCCCGRGTLLGTPGIVLAIESEIIMPPTVLTRCELHDAPLYYSMGPLPLTDGGCSNCANVAAAQILTWVANTCRWSTANIPLCTSQFRWILDLAADNVNAYLRLLRATGSLASPQAVYSLPLGEWVPLGGNALNLVGDPDLGCLDYPAAITVTPSFGP